jgi:hypothetical protein
VRFNAMLCVAALRVWVRHSYINAEGGGHRVRFNAMLCVCLPYVCVGVIYEATLKVGLIV